MKKKKKLDDLIFTFPTGILGSVVGGVYTGMIASPENPQDMKYILGGLALGSIVGYCMDYFNSRR